MKNNLWDPKPKIVQLSRQNNSAFLYKSVGQPTFFNPQTKMNTYISKLYCFFYTFTRLFLDRIEGKTNSGSFFGSDHRAPFVVCTIPKLPLFCRCPYFNCLIFIRLSCFIINYVVICYKWYCIFTLLPNISLHSSGMHQELFKINFVPWNIYFLFPL